MTRSKTLTSPLAESATLETLNESLLLETSYQNYGVSNDVSFNDSKLDTLITDTFVSDALSSPNDEVW